MTFFSKVIGTDGKQAVLRATLVVSVVLLFVVLSDMQMKNNRFIQLQGYKPLNAKIRVTVVHMKTPQTHVWLGHSNEVGKAEFTESENIGGGLDIQKEGPSSEPDGVFDEPTETNTDLVRISQQADFMLEARFKDEIPVGNTSNPLLPLTQVFPNKMKTFVFRRNIHCAYYCKLLLRSGWTKQRHTQPTPELLVLRPGQLERYNTVNDFGVNLFGFGSSCIGGGKATQLWCREQFALNDGCSFDDLGVQPPQWDMGVKDSCLKFFAMAMLPENKEKIWISKRTMGFHGKGIQLWKGPKELRKRFSCRRNYGSENARYLVQEYLEKPALMGGHKFDFRTYLLVASMKPFIGFYHRGFVRRSQHAYDKNMSNLRDTRAHITNAETQSEDNHFFSFQELQEILTRESGFDSNFMNETFEPAAMRASNFLLQSAKRLGKHIPGRSQMFALDWMLNEDGSAHLLEANGNPQISTYPSNVQLTPKIWLDMLDVVHKVQVEPHLLPENFSVKAKTTIGGW
eukprot:CAMPEP_0203755580 /NCGR_PEP_ID=MMETSP0098-20131031/9004_1 /ASSEMBLY_ACC=CAM_ASM_000208 /TAXON_ID=96639 /ORGANISM=" , Strain NY0313808BC1" /LENGTH=512 /DNA_ID=CAMNT_0050647107 /DNA_START=157 /DNA_END=1692 /DNA_ORIENTATION=+